MPSARFADGGLKNYPESRTGSLFAFHFDGRVVRVRNVFGQREPESEASVGSCPVGLIEPFENMRQVGQADPDAKILDRNCDLAALR